MTGITIHNSRPVTKEVYKGSMLGWWNLRIIAVSRSRAPCGRCMSQLMQFADAANAQRLSSQDFKLLLVAGHRDSLDSSHIKFNI